MIQPCSICRTLSFQPRVTLQPTKASDGSFNLSTMRCLVHVPPVPSSIFHTILETKSTVLGLHQRLRRRFLPDSERTVRIRDRYNLDSAASNAISTIPNIRCWTLRYSSGTSQRSSTIVSVDLTKLPINGTYEIMDAFFTLNTKSRLRRSVVEWICTQHRFDGDANWNNATNSTQWNSPGAYHSSDTDIHRAEPLLTHRTQHIGDITLHASTSSCERSDNA